MSRLERDGFHSFLRNFGPLAFILIRSLPNTSVTSVLASSSLRITSKVSAGKFVEQWGTFFVIGFSGRPSLPRKIPFFNICIVQQNCPDSSRLLSCLSNLKTSYRNWRMRCGRRGRVFRRASSLLTGCIKICNTRIFFSA